MMRTCSWSSNRRTRGVRGSILPPRSNASRTHAQTHTRTHAQELQSTYKESMDALEKLKDESAPKIKLLKAATPQPKKEEAAGKDEV